MSTFGIRDELHDFWFRRMQNLSKCDSYDTDERQYESRYHTQGVKPDIEKCLSKLDDSKEYNHIKENFLIEYEDCINQFENNNTLKNLFNTFCLDIIVLRRLLIEHKLCCVENDTSIQSTLCSLKNFNKTYVDYNITTLINFAKQSSSTSWTEVSLSESSFKTINLYIFTYTIFITLIILIFSHSIFYE
jgi:hypothetical protein